MIVIGMQVTGILLMLTGAYVVLAVSFKLIRRGVWMVQDGLYRMSVQSIRKGGKKFSEGRIKYGRRRGNRLAEDMYAMLEVHDSMK